MDCLVFFVSCVPIQSGHVVDYFHEYVCSDFLSGSQEFTLAEWMFKTQVLGLVENITWPIKCKKLKNLSILPCLVSELCWIFFQKEVNFARKKLCVCARTCLCVCARACVSVHVRVCACLHVLVSVCVKALCTHVMRQLCVGVSVCEGRVYNGCVCFWKLCMRACERCVHVCMRACERCVHVCVCACKLCVCVVLSACVCVCSVGESEVKPISFQGIDDNSSIMYSLPTLGLTLGENRHWTSIALFSTILMSTRTLNTRIWMKHLSMEIKRNVHSTPPPPPPKKCMYWWVVSVSVYYVDTQNTYTIKRLANVDYGDGWKWWKNGHGLIVVTTRTRKESINQSMFSLFYTLFFSRAWRITDQGWWTKQ